METIGLTVRWYLAFRHPIYAYDSITFDRRLARQGPYQTRIGEYEAHRKDPVTVLAERFPRANVPALFEEVRRKTVLYDRIRELARTPDRLLYPTRFSVSFHKAEVLYVLARLLKPRVVLETGVANGMSSTFLLQALVDNGSGVLHSVEYPPFGKFHDPRVGALVPEGLRGPWTVHRGKVSRVFPRLVPALGEVDLFMHDSEHTYENMSYEMRTVWPRISQRGILASDDIIGNNAYLEFCEELHRDPLSLRMPERENALGFLPKIPGVQPDST